MNSSWKKYIFWFAQEHIEFRHPEIQSILRLFNITMKWVEFPTPDIPYWVVYLPSEEAALKIASRSISLRYCAELWVHEKSISSLHKKLKQTNDTISEYFKPKKSFKIAVETFNKHFTQKEKVNKIETFSYLPVDGAVNLKHPDLHLKYIEYYGLNPNCVPDEPLDVIFCRWVSDGARHLIAKLSLKTRKFIGNTSMDAQLSLLMANQAGVVKGDIVLDPFVGSGSLLVAAAYFGAFVYGTDIDYLMLHARTRPSRITQMNRDKDESVYINMKQYGLENQYLDVIVSDFARPLWKHRITFDAIITDPPYGIREATERVGIEKSNYELSEKHLLNHIPAKVEYSLSQIYSDLLHFSAMHLNMHGRLVCWFPVYRQDYSQEGLPLHPCLQLISNSEQVLSTHSSRRLLTYEKISEPNVDIRLQPTEMISDFRNKYFSHNSECRRIKKIERKDS